MMTVSCDACLKMAEGQKLKLTVPCYLIYFEQENQKLTEMYTL